MKVKANYRGKGKMFGGTIKRDNRDGTYDINYDDGDREMGVREADIQAENSDDDRDRDRGRSRGPRLEEGMKVKANYKGKGKFFGGTIKRDNRDGTYDINYDDGDREMGVREVDIRAEDSDDDRDRDRGRSRAPRLEEGMKVTANYKGKGKYFGGKIKRDNRDGTYDISYDDGDREMGVREVDIRAEEDDDRTAAALVRRALK